MGPDRFRAEQLCHRPSSDCATVYTYLDAQAKDPTSYVGSPLWSIVDGPWRLSAFNADGHVTFVPNKSYSGPVKPKLAAFEEAPFTTDAAEYNVLRSPSAGTKIDVGYTPRARRAGQAGQRGGGRQPAVSRGYNLAPGSLGA